MPCSCPGGPTHADIGHVAVRQAAPWRRGRDVRVRAHHGAGAAVQVPAHGVFSEVALGMHVAEDDLIWGCAARMASAVRNGHPAVQEDGPIQVHDEDVVTPGR